MMKNIAAVESPLSCGFSSGEDKKIKKSPNTRKSSSKKKKQQEQGFNECMYPLNLNAIKKKTQGVTIATEENEMLIYNSTSQITVHERLFHGTKPDPLKLTQMLQEKSKQHSPLTYSERKYLQAQNEMQCSFKPQISERSH